MGSSDLPEEKVDKVASQTIQNVRSRLTQISEDPGVIMVFKVLVTLSVSAQFTDHNRLLSIFGHCAPILDLIKSNSSRFKVYQYRGVITLRVLFK